MGGIRMRLQMAPRCLVAGSHLLRERVVMDTYRRRIQLKFTETVKRFKEQRAEMVALREQNVNERSRPILSLRCTVNRSTPPCAMPTGANNKEARGRHRISRGVGTDVP